MTEIEALEQEIREKQAHLRALKKAKRDGEKLCFEKYRKFEENGFDDVCNSDPLVGHLRNFVLALSTVYPHVYQDGRKCLYYHATKVKVCDVSEERIRICNLLIEELYPIISKYVDIFLAY